MSDFLGKIGDFEHFWHILVHPMLLLWVPLCYLMECHCRALPKQRCLVLPLLLPDATRKERSFLKFLLSRIQTSFLLQQKKYLFSDQANLGPDHLRSIRKTHTSCKKSQWFSALYLQIRSYCNWSSTVNSLIEARTSI